MNKVILLTALLVASLGLVYGAPRIQRAELEDILSEIQDAIEQADESEQVDDLAQVSVLGKGKLKKEKEALQKELSSMNSELKTVNKELCKFSNTIAEVCASYSPKESTAAQGKLSKPLFSHMTIADQLHTEESMEGDAQGICKLHCKLKKEVKRLRKEVKNTKQKVTLHKNALGKLHEFVKISRPHICGVRDTLKSVCSAKKPSEEELVEEEGFFF